MSRQFLINWKATKEAKKKITDGRIMTGQITYPFSGMDINILSFFWFHMNKIYVLKSECGHAQ